MEGIERLEKEVAEMDDYNISAIWEYLKKREDLYDKFDNEEKTAEGLYDYVYDKASQKKTKRRMAMVADNVVYLWAVNYFTKSNEELGIKEKKKTQSPTNKANKTIKKEEEKQEEKPNDEQISIFQEVQK